MACWMSGHIDKDTIFHLDMHYEDHIQNVSSRRTSIIRSVQTVTSQASSLVKHRSSTAKSILLPPNSFGFQFETLSRSSSFYVIGFDDSAPSRTIVFERSPILADRSITLTFPTNWTTTRGGAAAAAAAAGAWLLCNESFHKCSDRRKLGRCSSTGGQRHCR